MVQIPTSRDVAYAGTRSGRSMPSGPSVSVGAAVAGVGQGIVQSAFNLNDLKTQENADILNDKSNTVSTNLNKFIQDEEERFNKAREGASESGIGFTRQMMEGYKQRADAFAKANFQGLTKDAQTGYNNNLLSAGNAIYDKAYSFEDKTKAAYYDRSTNGSLDGIRTQIQSNSASFDDLKKRGLEAIDATNMPEAWKAERRQQWDADAAESRWKWNYSQNPKAALSDLKPAPDTAALLAHEEGFRDKPYWDVNAWRIGYGSDTVTTPDGKHIPVTPDMVITKADADRDLQYRLSEREGAQARKQVGAGWGSLPGNVQTALESVAYNYGSLPDPVVTAAQSGDVEAIASAVEGLDANPARRKREAAIIRGEATLPMVDKYADIPLERREQLQRQGEQEYAQQQTRQRTQIKDDYSLQIATSPEKVRETSILADPTLDNGDKAQLINSLHSALKENAGVGALIQAIGNGKGSVNPFDSEQTKVAEKAYDQMVGGASAQDKDTITSGFIAQTGYIPKAVQADIRRGATATDAGTMASTMQMADVLQKNAPASFAAFEGSGAIQKNLDQYRTYTGVMGYTPEEAGKKLVDSNNPEAVRNREALLKSDPIKKLVKDVDASSIAGAFDKSFAGLARNPSVGGVATPDQVRVGVNSDAEAVIVSDYRSMFEEALVDTNGNEAAARDIATKRFQRSYAPSQFTPFGGNVIVKNPPEIAYPAGADGTHNYIRSQLTDALKEQGVKADAFFLQPDSGTEADIKAGRPAAYRVFYQEDGKLQMFPYPFRADPQAAQQKDKDEHARAIEDAKGRMVKNRSVALDTKAAEDEAIKNTVGPDWMKARAAETARERVRIDDMFGGPLAPSTVNNGSGGGGGF